MSLPFELASSVVQSVRYTTISRYAGASAVTLLLYDHFLTIDAELRLFWDGRWSLVKGIFFLNRWIVPIFLILAAHVMSGFHGPFSDDECRKWFLGTMYFMQFSVYSLLALLQLRIFVLFHRHQRVIVPMVVVYYLSWAASFALLVTSTLKTQVEYDPVVASCLVVDPPSTLRYMFVASFALEFALFATFGIKASAHLHSGAPLDTLIGQVFLYGVRYCLWLMCLRIFNMVVWLSAPPSLLFMSLFLFWVATVISVNHVLLQIRSHIKRENNVARSGVPNHSLQLQIANSIRTSSAWRSSGAWLSQPSWRTSHSSAAVESFPDEKQSSGTVQEDGEKAMHRIDEEEHL